MARTSKTKVGGGPRQEPMMRAQEVGLGGVARAVGESAAQYERTGRDIQQSLAGAAREFDERKLRRDTEKTRKAERQEDIERQERQFGQQMDLRQRQLNLETAKAGFQQGQPTGPGGQAQGPPMSPEMARRHEALALEMQRGEQQAQMPAEMDPSGNLVPTPYSEREQDIREMRARTEQTRVEVMQQNAISKAINASARGDLDAYRESRKNYAAAMKQTVGMAEKILNGKSHQLTPAEKGYIKRIAEGNPDKELQQEIAKGLYGPRTAQILRGKAFADALPFVAIRGDFPDPDLVMRSNPKYRELIDVYLPGVQEQLRARQKFGPIPGVDSVEVSERVLLQAAAQAMLKEEAFKRNLARMKANGAPTSPELPTPSVNPNAPAPPSAEQQRSALQGGRQPQVGGPRPLLPGSRAIPRGSQPVVEFDPSDWEQQR